MNKILAIIVASLLALPSIAQSYKISWGDEMKLKKGTTDLDIISADNTGLYFAESKVYSKGYFVVYASTGVTQKLYKLDKNYNEIFEKDYRKELKGLSYNSFAALDNDIYIFATDFIKKDKLFKVYGSKVDKNTGDLPGDFKELGSFSMESKRDDYEMKVTKIRAGKNFLVVADISAKERISLGVSVLDKNFSVKEDATIDLSFNRNEFSLQDVKYTADDKIVLLGKQFEEAQVGKKKRKRWVFKQYTLLVYDKKGKKEKEIAVDAGNRYVINGTLLEQNDGGMLLAGFYSNNTKKDQLSGFFINKINVASGSIALASFKEINGSMIGKNVEDGQDDDDDTKAERKERERASKDDDDEDIPNDYIIRNVDVNPVDQSIIITSEISQVKEFTSTSMSTSGGRMSYSTTTTIYFTNQDILIIKADKDGNISWLNDIPKRQLEAISAGSTSHSGISFSMSYVNYFANGGGMPYYSSFISTLRNNQFFILLNDHPSNNVNASFGDKVRQVYNFKKKSNMYGISIDLTTGKMTRKMIFANDPGGILMPRHGYVVNNDVVIPSFRLHALGKTELKFARVTIK